MAVHEDVLVVCVDARRHDLTVAESNNNAAASIDINSADGILELN